MIYEYPPLDAPIRQGDVFTGLPRVEVSLGRIPVLEGDGSMAERDWREIAAQDKQVTAVFPIIAVTAIVATQDCDATHGQDITLCEIRPFRKVELKAAQTSSSQEMERHTDPARPYQPEVVLLAARPANWLCGQDGCRFQGYHSRTAY